MNIEKTLSPNFFAPGVMSHHVSLEPGDFERSFYYNLLLQPPVSILDTAFFIVKEMEEQYRAPVGFTWLQAAVKAGAIIPIFREGNSFQEVVSKLKSDNFVGLTPDAQNIASGLDAHGIKEVRRFPSRSVFHMGRSLGEQLQGLFLQREAPVLSRLPDRALYLISEFWDRTASWRRRWIETAVSARDYARDGLRLSELYLIAARTLDPEGGSKITNGQDVLAVARRALDDPMLVQDVRALLILMDLVWQQNFRTGMRKSGVAMGLCLPRWHPLLSYFDLDIMPPTGVSAIDQDSDFEPADALDVELTIELPTLSALKKTDGNVFTTIWENGAAYRKALHSWRQMPTRNNYRFLANEIGQYSEIIRRAVQSGTPLQKFDVASIETNLLVTILGAALGASTVYAVQHMRGLSDADKNVLPIVAQLSPVLVLIPSTFRRFREVKATIGHDDIIIGSGNRQIVLT